MNLQLFAEGGASGAAGTGSSTGAQFDYEKLAGLLARIRNHLPEPYIVWQYFEEAVV